MALELAATWVDSLTLSGIATELQSSLDLLASELVDLPERHRSLRTTFDATWKLLDPAERAAFMRLSVFRGGFTREAAEQTSGALLARPGAPDRQVPDSVPACGRALSDPRGAAPVRPAEAR